jgi:glucokinase
MDDEREPGQALVGNVGRSSITLALVDEHGRVRHDTTRNYEPSTQPTVSGAIASYGRELGLMRLPRRCALAVAGAAQGDTIMVTHSRWVVSRTGLAQMLRAPPLLLNDFAAHAWAMTARNAPATVSPLAGPPVKPDRPGSYCIIGLGRGLGVALVANDEEGNVNVTPTEAGHTTFLAGLAATAPIAALIDPRHAAPSAEMMLSESGLFAVYEALAKLRGIAMVHTDAELFLAHARRPGRDALATEAMEFCAGALWHFAGNLVMAFGAWDGVILTGTVADMLRPMLTKPDHLQNFAIHGPFERRLSGVPRSLFAMPHAELEGAAVALMMEERRQRRLLSPAA